MSAAESQPEPLCLNLGCGRDIKPGFVNIDARGHPGVDVIADLGKCRNKRLPFKESSVDLILMSHVLEHIVDSLGLMQELHRIAKPNALLTIRAPYGSSDDAWGDQTHVRAYFLQSFETFAQTYYERADYGYRGDWRFVQCFVLVDQEDLDFAEVPVHEHLMRRLFHERNFVRELIVEMRAVKPIRPQKFINDPPKINFVPVKK
jgi:SAM-dependent methyltransferase